MRWVKLNPQTITQKSAIMVEHFRDNVALQLDGHAKAMVVTDARKAAMRSRLAIDADIASKGYGYGSSPSPAACRTRSRAPTSSRGDHEPGPA